MDLEKKISELEEIVNKLDSNISLEKSIELFEKGVSISKECLNDLKTFSGKITQIKEEMDKLIEVEMGEE